MTDIDPAAAAGTERFTSEPDVEGAAHVEMHGFDYIREEGRYLQPRQLFSFWWGCNISIIYMLVGAIVISLGVAFWQAILIIAGATCGFILIGVAGIGGPRSGVPTMTFTRASFGVQGNRINSLIAYGVQIGSEVLNALLVVLALTAIASELGWHHPGKAGLALFVLIAMILPAIVAVIGHRLLFLAQKWITWTLSFVLLLVAIFTIPKFHWGFHATATGHLALFAAIMVAIAQVFANPLSYANVSADYSRYLPSRTSGRAITWWTFAGVGGIAFLLQFLGAGIATTASGIETDPVSGFRHLLPSWLYVLFIINAAFGAMANNAITFYGSGLTMQSLGVPLLRWRATLVDCVISTGLVLYIELFNQSLQTIFSDYLAFINVWAGPFLAILLIDGLARRWRYDAAGLHKISVLSPYWGTGGFNLRGFTALILGAAVGMLTVNAPIYVGPLAKAIGGADLAWLAPMVIGGVVYAVLAVPSIRAGRHSQVTRSDPAAQAGPAPASQ